MHDIDIKGRYWSAMQYRAYSPNDNVIDFMFLKNIQNIKKIRS